MNKPLGYGKVNITNNTNLWAWFLPFLRSKINGNSFQNYANLLMDCDSELLFCE
jgi:hypothetical protein